MQPMGKEYGTFRPSDGQGLVLAMLIPLVACGLQLFFWAALQPHSWLLFCLAVFFSSWVGGRRGGLVATALSTVLVCYFFIPPRFSFAIERPSDFVSIGIFVTMGILFTFFHERLRQANRLAADAQFRALFEQAAVGMTQVGLDGSFLRVNQQLCDMLGYSREELLAKTFQEITHPADLDADITLLRRVLAGEIPTYTLEKRYFRKDQSTVTANLTVALVRDALGQPEYFISVVEDITARKRAAAALQEREEQLRLYAEHGPAAVAMFDPDMKYLVVSRRWLETYRLGSRDIIGRSHYEIFPEITERWKEIHRRCLAGAVEKCDEDPFPRLDGTTDWLRWEVRPWHKADGSIGGIIIFSEDITQRKQAEAALRESEARFRTVVETAPEAIFIQTNSCFAYANAAALRLFGATQPAELLGQPVISRVHPDYQAGVLERIRTINGQRQRAGSGDTVFITLDGSERNVITSGVPFNYQNQNGALVFAVDITARKQAETLLQENRAKLEAALASMTDAVFISDAAGQFLEFNDAFATFHRFKNKAECLKTFAEYPDILDVFLPSGELAPVEMWAVPRALRGERITNAEYTLRRKDTGETWVGSYSFSPIRDSAGVIVGSVVVGRDITESKRAEREVVESEKKYRALFENMSAGFVLFEVVQDDQGVPVDLLIIAANRGFATTTGLQPQAVIGKRLTAVLPGIADDAADWIGTYGKVALTGESRQFEQGSELLGFYYSITAYQSAAKQCAVTFVDVTERRQAEEKIKSTLADLERSNKELEHFAYVASHDLQEPLRMVSSYTQLLAQQYEAQLDDKARKYIHYAVDGSVRMQTLINDLLTYSRVGRRGKPLEPTDAHAVLGEALRNLAAAIVETHAVITNDELPTVLADASQLVLVFQNLLANAIKFRRAELPRIHVSARERGGEWLFAVKDNGIGIEAQYAERVFIIFQRLHTKEEYPGTGIGLAVCQRIVERHGGKIWFESAPGSGTTFLFTVPKCL